MLDLPGQISLRVCLNTKIFQSGSQVKLILLSLLLTLVAADVNYFKGLSLSTTPFGPKRHGLLEDFFELKPRTVFKSDAYTCHLVAMVSTQNNMPIAQD